ncbi:hypothetical protein VST63_20020 [Mycolicibacterium sp. 050232]|uniref:hypothetical protein n=1 Tax=Mycolicibacterium sp. 050232 TaxID=3113982 RepID=UPI002E28176E|nr:hypothetical protein [Mycolicibacterium sp. 050232]MED5814651.1 hypothetical protein [Mycolicibacterium sp. 050232]
MANAAPGSEAGAISKLTGVLGGDLGVILAQVTPLKGVVLAPVNNFGWDSDARIMTFTSDFAAFKKLRRLEQNPQVTVVFHAREHGTGSGTEYVLVQGTADFSWAADRQRLAELFDDWRERVNRGGRRDITLGPADLGGRFWNWWLAPFFWHRAIVRVHAHRIIAFPDSECLGPPTVIGPQWPVTPAGSQKPPANGAGPRVPAARAAGAFSELPHRLLGWVGSDGYPIVVPAEAVSADEDGMTLMVPPGLVPDGQRRAGLTAHWFSEGTLGQRQIVMTGWLTDGDRDGRLRYAPHTRLSYRIPPSRTLWRVFGGAIVRVGLWRARRAGVRLGDPATV